MRTAAGIPPPLAGVRVLDLTRLLPGPLCGQHLADFGADVIKIEDTGAGDYVRPALRPMVNRGKRALRVNLKREEGKALLRRLCGTADVLIESFRPGVMKRLGLDYDALRAVNERLVYCSITGYGQEGARALAAGHDLNYLSLTGVLDQAAMHDGQPVLPGFHVADLLGGTLTAAVGILAALLEARSSGHGRHVDVSMTDAVLAHSVLPVSEVNDRGAESCRGSGSTTGGAARYNVYRTRDERSLAVGAQEKKFWDQFCSVIGRPELAECHATAGAKAEEVKQVVAAAIKARTLSEWVQRFAGQDCCVSPVLSVSEALKDPEMQRRGVVGEREGQYRLGPPCKMSGLEVDLFAPSPRQGEHTSDILAELGYGPAEIDVLRASGVV